MVESNNETYDRLLNEYFELRKRIEKLDVFIQANADRNTSPFSDEYYRMIMIQYHAMCAYEGALRTRLEFLGIKIHRED